MKPPLISVIIPCYNEEATIAGLLDAILHQTYPTEEIEVVIADGNSEDHTLERITEFQKSHPELQIKQVDNPKRTIPGALNKAIEQSQGEFIVRLDGHTIPAADYVNKCIRALEEGLGDNVGGVLQVKPRKNTWIGRSIAMAAVHPLGVGDARYRHATVATESDTVAFGSFRHSLIDRIGKYDESLPINEDYEFNARIRAIGGKIWVDPAIRAVYYSRPDLKSLSKQYFLYGYWKFRMLRRYPRTLRWRQALPPIFVFGLLMLLLLSLFLNLARIGLAFVCLSYLLILLAGAIRPSIKARLPLAILGIPIAILTMHFSWGMGFWWSIMKLLTTNK